MHIFSEIGPLQTYIHNAKQSGLTVGFVPTMGALHQGHLSLVEASKKVCDITIVSIFVNPTQFGPNEDYDTYPRQLDEDYALLQSAGVNAVFSPEKETIYPSGFGRPTRISVPGLSERFCGASRPGFFDGVCTVVNRLFNIVSPDKAFFGEKDFQQVAVISKMVRDLFIPVDIVPCPIIREPHGLAMSSRNAYLSESERQEASTIYAALLQAKKVLSTGSHSASDILTHIRNTIASTSITIDYCVIVDPITLQEKDMCSSQDRILFAGTIGKTRLIDNI